MGEFHQFFLWRIAGFPCELLEQFALDPIARELSVILSRGAMKGNVPWKVRWSQVQPQLENRALENRFEKAFRMLRLRLREIVQAPKFQVAVSCSSPMAAVALSRIGIGDIDIRRSKDKRLELLGIRYLQRLVTKCETSAFFGPVAIGMFTDVGSIVEYQYDPLSYQGYGFLGDQFLKSIVRLLRRLPNVLEGLWVRRRSGVVLGACHTVIHPRLGVLQLDPRVFALLSVVSSVPTKVADLVLGKTETESWIFKVVLALLEIGILSDELDLTWHINNPVEYLRHVLTRSTDIPIEIMVLLNLLGEALVQWPVADATSRAHLLDTLGMASKQAGIPNQSTGGGFYADHLPLVEDGFCHKTHLHLDRRWATRFLSDLETVVQEGLIMDCTRRRAMRQRIAHLTKFKHKTVVPLPEFVAEMSGLSTLGKLEDELIKDPPVRLSEPVITSPDVMVAAMDLKSLRRGDCEWVLSECHSSVGCAGFFVRVMTERDRWLSAISHFIADQLKGLQPVAVTSEIRNKTFYQGALPCVRYLEVGSPAPQGADTIALDELAVAIDQDVRLVVRATNDPVVLLPGPWGDAEILNWFRTPRFVETVTRPSNKRTVRNSVVIRRATWELAGSDLPSHHASPFEVFAWIQAQREEQGLPRWVFVHPSTERKPLCIDMSNPFLCEELVRVLRKESNLAVEEMYPAPTEAWVSGPDGRYLSELRLLYASGGDL